MIPHGTQSLRDVAPGAADWLAVPSDERADTGEAIDRPAEAETGTDADSDGGGSKAS